MDFLLVPNALPTELRRLVNIMANFVVYKLLMLDSVLNSAKNDRRTGYGWSKRPIQGSIQTQNWSDLYSTEKSHEKSYFSKNELCMNKTEIAFSARLRVNAEIRSKTFVSNVT